MADSLYEEEGRFVSRYDQEQLLKVARETYDDFREVPQDFQVSILKRVDKVSFDAFRLRCKAGETKKKGYPRFKMRVRSLTWCLRKHKLKTGECVRQNPIIETDFRHNRLKVPKLGEVKIYMHRPLVGDRKKLRLSKKRRVGMPISPVRYPIPPKLNRLVLMQLTLALHTI